MAAYQLYSKLQTFWGESAQLLAGGQLRFFTSDTLSPQDVYGDEALSVNNGATVDLDASGRPSLEIWADTADAYFVELYDSDGVKQGEDRKSVPGGAGQTIPVPNAGEYLTGDGTNFAVADLTNSLLPDMTGHSNEILTTDGTTASWGARPADGAAGTSDVAVDGATSLEIGDGDASNYFKQSGTATATASNTRSCSKSVTYPVAFASAPNPPTITPYGAAPTVGGVLPSWRISSYSTTGFTVEFNTLSGGTSSDSSSSNNIITSDITFGYVAEGTKTA